MELTLDGVSKQRLHDNLINFKQIDLAAMSGIQGIHADICVEM